jgi:hypothetical protein
MRNCMELGVRQGRKDCGICHPTQRSLELPTAAPQAHPVSHITQMGDADDMAASYDGFDIDPTPTSLEQIGYWLAILITVLLTIVVLCGGAGYLYIRTGAGA